MKDFVLKCYDEYKIFMDVGRDILPQLNPILLANINDNNGKTPLAYVNANEVLLPNVNLYINPKLFDFDYKEQFRKAKLFHEFTHILDANILFKNYEYKKMETLLSIYSEYHASQIELTYNVGFKNIHNSHKLNLDNTFIAYESKSIKITNDYLQPMADSLCIIDKPSHEYNNLNAVEYYQNYSVFEAKTMYYLGKRDFCEKYSYVKIPDITEKSYGQFASYIINIRKYIKEKNFSLLINTREQLWNKYTSYFICKN